MNDRPLTLELAREGRRLKASIVEGGDKTLRPYEIHEVDWQQVENSCREVLNILRRANGSVKPSSEILVSLKKSGQLLYDLLVPPQAKEKLAATGANILTLRLEDTLVHIPWELLYNGREFLCRRFAVGRIASTRQTPTARSTRAPMAPFKVLVIADPRGDLGDAYREGLEIKSFLDQNREVFHVDFKSHPVDVAFVKKNIRDYDIIHYAGHAYYDAGNASESGWLLSDGTLKASEIAALGGFQPMPALLFSNACQSGQSDPWKSQDEIFGLANAFLLSGAQHYIGTFWEIVDEPSLRFAKYFYQSIAAGEAVGPALRSSRRAIIDTGGEEGLVWANYMLYGEPSREFGAAEPKKTPRDDRFDWTRILHDRVPAAAAKENVRRSLLSLSLTSILLIALIYGGYSLFYSGASNQKAKPSVEPTGQSVESAAVTSPLSLTVNMIGQRKDADGSYSEVIVKEGSVLRSGDHFQVQIETNRPTHIYVLIFDSHGRASQLFPDPKIETPGFVEGGRKIAVPDKDLWYWLDERSGTETIYVLASEEPMADIRGLLSKMAKAGDAERKRLSGEIKQQIQIVERGVGGMAKGKTVSYPMSDGRHIQKVTEVVAGSGAVVRAISFEHR